MNYRIIALDLDGTLLDDASRIPERNIQALHTAADHGALIVCASGRMSESIRRIPHSIGLDGPIISYNGAMARDSLAHGDGILFHTPLASEYADALIDYTRAEHFHLNFYLDECLYARDDADLRRFSDIYHSRTASVFQFVPDLEHFKGYSPTKLILITDKSDPTHPNPRHRDEQYEYWQQKWGREVWLIRTDPEYLEFMNPHANKGIALERIAMHFGIPQEQVIAFGDGRNDTAMLEWAGLGVAMANAHPEVKAAADYISPCTNNDCGVAEAIEKFMFGGS